MFVVYREKGDSDERKLYQKAERLYGTQLASGDYQNASELVREALRLHKGYRHKVINDLKAEIEKDWNSPDSKRSAQDIIAAKTQMH